MDSEAEKINAAWEEYDVIRDKGESAKDVFGNGARSGIELGKSEVWESLYIRHTPESLPAPDDVYRPVYFKVLSVWHDEAVTYWDEYGITIADPDEEEEEQRIPWALVDQIIELADIPEPWRVLKLEEQ